MRAGKQSPQRARRKFWQKRAISAHCCEERCREALEERRKRCGR
jgi:hypothetical protein